MIILKAAEIARFLDLPLEKGDSTIIRVDDLAEAGPGGMVWLRRFNPLDISRLNDKQPALVICDRESVYHLKVPCIPSPNPRLSFIRILDRYFKTCEQKGIDPTARIDPGAKIEEGVVIGAHVYVGGNVHIGSETVVGSGVVIEGDVTIGCRCRIKPNAVIGAQGFSFEKDENGVPQHFPHIGHIEIGQDVWIGSCSTIELAGLGSTILEDGVKVDDLVQIGHNTRTGKNSLVMANVVLCGGVTIGEGCWIAPNAVIKQKVRIGNYCTVGLGAVVLKDVSDGETVVGVPAKPLLR